MTTTEADRRAYDNIINAPDAIAGIELVAAHREAGCAKLREALEEIVEATKYVPNAYAKDANRLARAALGDH